MRSATRIKPHLAHGLLTMLIVLVVALRTVVAPAMVGASDPGVMTICTGGEIYYITLDGTPVDGPATTPDPCPYIGMTLAMPMLDAHTPSPGTIARQVALPLPQSLAIRAEQTRQNAPRAPPFPA